MDIGILGTGTLAEALGRAWAAAGHSLVVTGRDPAHAAIAAERIGTAATAVDPADFAERVDAVLVAVAWEGLEAALALVGAPRGSLSGTTVLDATNAVDFGTGRLGPATGSAAEVVARTAVGAHVVKALHLFAGASWPYQGPESEAPVVALCGDDESALEHAMALIRDLRGHGVVVGSLAAARQLEEVAGFVMRVVAAGHNPRFAVPDVRR